MHMVGAGGAAGTGSKQVKPKTHLDLPCLKGRGRVVGYCG